MNPIDEVQIVVGGIEYIKSQICSPKYTSLELVELLERLENLRFCLETLLKKELKL